MPHAASWLPILLGHIGSQIKRRQSQSYKFKEFAKIWMCKYEVNLTSVVERYRADTILSTDKQMDRRTRWNQYTPLSTSLKRGYNNATRYGLKAEPAKHLQKTSNKCKTHYGCGHDMNYWFLIRDVSWFRASFNMSYTGLGHGQFLSLKYPITYINM